MGAGTREVQIALTRARLVKAHDYLKKADDPDREKVARSWIDQLLDELNKLLRT